MSEELLQEETTMADLEEHFDDANPWNVVQSYMENKTILPVKVCAALFQHPSFPFPILRIWRPIF